MEFELFLVKSPVLQFVMSLSYWIESLGTCFANHIIKKIDYKIQKNFNLNCGGAYEDWNICA